MESFHPPNEWEATGTGIGTLTPTMPICTFRWKCRAAAPSEVNTATPLPYGVALMIEMASSRLAARVTPRTGPKISSS